MSGPPLLRSLPELVERGLITAEQAQRIRQAYAPSEEQRTDRGLLLFSLLGALLVGTGIVLLVAHNWDRLPRLGRTVLAFVPLLLGQALCLYTLLKRADRAGRREGGALFLSFAVAAAMSLVAQIYHIASDLDAFFLAWAVLILGVVYLMRSFGTALLYLALITAYVVGMRMDGPVDAMPWPYLPLLLAILPFYLRHLRQRPASVSTFWLSFFVAVSFAIGSQMFWQDLRVWGWTGVAALAAAYGVVPVLGPAGARLSPFRGIGTLTVLVMLYVFGSQWMGWNDTGVGPAPRMDLFVLAVMLGMGAVAYARAWPRRSPRQDPFPELAIAVIVLILMGMRAPSMAMLLSNVLLLAVGVVVVRQGIAENALGRMNLGLLILAVTIVSRFFDLDVGFLVKGLLSIGIGLAFLLLNLRLLRARKAKGHA